MAAALLGAEVDAEGVRCLMEAYHRLKRLPVHIDDDPTQTVVRIAATAKGKALLEAGRERRLEVLTAQIETLSRVEREALQRGVESSNA